MRGPGCSRLSSLSGSQSTAPDDLATSLEKEHVPVSQVSGQEAEFRGTNCIIRQSHSRNPFSKSFVFRTDGGSGASPYVEGQGCTHVLANPPRVKQHSRARTCGQSAKFIIGVSLCRLQQYTIRRPPDTTCSIIALKSGQEKFWIKTSQNRLDCLPNQSVTVSAGEQETPAEYGPL
jgi:hypothetical protein